MIALGGEVVPDQAGQVPPHDSGHERAPSRAVGIGAAEVWGEFLVKVLLNLLVVLFAKTVFAGQAASGFPDVVASKGIEASRSGRASTHVAISGGRDRLAVPGARRRPPPELQENAQKNRGAA